MESTVVSAGTETVIDVPGQALRSLAMKQRNPVMGLRSQETEQYSQEMDLTIRLLAHKRLLLEKPTADLKPGLGIAEDIALRCHNAVEGCDNLLSSDQTVVVGK